MHAMPKIKMSAEIIPFIPKPNPNRPTLMEEAERKAEEFLNRAPSLIVPYGGAGIDGMTFTDSDPA